MHRLYICGSYYHLYVSIIKMMFDTESVNDIVIYRNYHNINDIFASIRKLIPSVRLLNQIQTYENQETKKYRGIIDNTIYRKKVLVEYYKEKLELHGYNEIVIFNDLTSIGTYVLLQSGTANVVLYEDGKNSRNLFHKRSVVREIMENLGIDVKTRGKDPNIKVIEYSNHEYVPLDRLHKFRQSNLFELENKLNLEQKQVLKEIFGLNVKVDLQQNSAIVLTQPFFDESIINSPNIQRKLYSEIVKIYLDKFDIVYIKPHPRDTVDYQGICNDKKVVLIQKSFPFEMFKILDISFSSYITIFSTTIESVDKKKRVNLIQSDNDEVRALLSQIFNKEYLNKIMKMYKVI